MKICCCYQSDVNLPKKEPIMEVKKENGYIFSSVVSDNKNPYEEALERIQNSTSLFQARQPKIKPPTLDEMKEDLFKHRTIKRQF
jgi:hypothetical protein